MDSKEINGNKKGATKLWLHHQKMQVTCGIWLPGLFILGINGSFSSQGSFSSVKILKREKHDSRLALYHSAEQVFFVQFIFQMQKLQMQNLNS